jgi:hypothetical protein
MGRYLKILSAVFFMFITTGFSNGLQKPVRVGIIYEETVEKGERNLRFHMEVPVEWYKKVLQEPEFQLTVFKPEDLLDTVKFNRDNLDVFIFPYGSTRVPFDIYSDRFVFNLASFMEQGGHIILVNAGGYRSLYDGKKGEWLSSDSMEKLKEERITFNHKFLITFPVFDADISSMPATKLEPVINPEFKELLPGFPEKLDFPGQQWRSASVSLNRYMNAGTGFQDEIMAPLYQIEEKDARGNTVTTGPVWIIRHHCRRFNGSTAIVIQNRVWANYSNSMPVFSRPEGDVIIKGLINLCFARLPGEKTASYYEKKIALKDASSEIGRTYVVMREKAETWFRKLLWQNRLDELEKWREQKKLLEEKKMAFWTRYLRIHYEELSEGEIDSLLKEAEEIKGKLEKFLPEEVQTVSKKDAVKPTSFYFSIQGGYPDLHMYMNNLMYAVEAGINLIPFGDYYGFFADYMHKKTGMHFYAGAGYGGHHGGISRIPCEAFDPSTGKNVDNAARKNWLYTEKEYENIINRVSDNLEKARKKEWIDLYHLPNEMHIRYNQGWGKRGMELFHKYLEKEYGSVEKLNEVWKTGYKEFKEVVIPIKMPETTSEHIIWEDWILFRDNFISRYAEDLYNLVKKIDPDTPVLSRYFFQRQASVANSFSTLNEHCDINGNHSFWSHSLYLADWFHRIGRKRFYNSEYTFHKYQKTNDFVFSTLFRRDLWHGTSNGQVGFQIYPWYWAHVPFFESYAVMESDGRPRTMLWELKNFIKKSGEWSDIVVKGECMKRAEVAFLWSETSRRHQMDSLEGSPPFIGEINGFEVLLRNLHFEREVLTESEIEKEGVPENIKLLILPGSVYYEPSVYKKFEEFVKRGGWIFAVNNEGGYYDNRGQENFTLFHLSRTVPQKVMQTRFLRYGDRIFTEIASIKNWFIWKTITGEREGLVKTAEDESPVVVKIPVGEGGVIFSSIPVGRLYFQMTGGGLQTTRLSEQSLILQDVINDILTSLRIMPSAETHHLLEVHTWHWNDNKYLIMTNLDAGADNVFSVELPYAVEGIYDISRGQKAPMEIKEGKTYFSIYLDRGSGIILQVEQV